MKQRILICAYVIGLLAMSCEQSDPPNHGRFGDTVLFSGYEWDVKTSISPVGPGPNYFSDDEDDIFVDASGYLHMLISERNGIWYSTEIVSKDTMGYGTYKFTIQGDFVNMPENIVVGLFTWDDNTFYEQANSEIDVELSKWGDVDKENTLQYGIQPIAFSTFHPERVFNPLITESYLIGVSTHIFHWTESLVTFKSYSGETEDENMLISDWEFDLDNPARVKEEGGQSSLPIVIPAPGNTTNTRINYWILPWIDAGPTDGLQQEFIVRTFTFIPD
jgi:hypothetical protein